MTGREEAQRMLAVAEADFKALRNMLDADIFEDSVFGFHAQQAAEKSLKAWLSLRRIVYPKTHDLRILMNLLQIEAQEDCGPFAELVDLTDFAVQFRYDSQTVIGRLNRAEVLVKVETLRNHVQWLVTDAEVAE
jgi:HEPN domain-containing protein